jgi:hypothetical protein
MSVCIRNSEGSQSDASPILGRQAVFRRQLETLSSWQERLHKIDEKLNQTSEALATRGEKLLDLRSDFDALTLDFWKAFARSLGCENPVEVIASKEASKRSQKNVAIILFTVAMTIVGVVWCQANGYLLWAATVGIAGASALYTIISGTAKPIARARKVLEIVRCEQEPFWLTGGNGIALSSVGITPPPGAGWYQNTIQPNKFLNDLCGYVSNVKNGWYGRFASS